MSRKPFRENRVRALSEMFSLTDMSARMPCRLRSSGTKASHKGQGNPLTLFRSSLGLMEGLERARGADEQEEKGDDREPVSPEPRRQSRWPGWPRLRRASPSYGTHVE